ncbi:7451_t:CDS:2, partial [Acaulospora colombiana]
RDSKRRFDFLAKISMTDTDITVEIELDALNRITADLYRLLIHWAKERRDTLSPTAGGLMVRPEAALGEEVKTGRELETMDGVQWMGDVLQVDLLENTAKVQVQEEEMIGGHMTSIALKEPWVAPVSLLISPVTQPSMSNPVQPRAVQRRRSTRINQKKRLAAHHR